MRVHPASKLAIQEYLEGSGRFSEVAELQGMASSAMSRIFADCFEALSMGEQDNLAESLVCLLLTRDPLIEPDDAAGLILACCIRGAMRPFTSFQQDLERELLQEDLLQRWMISDDHVESYSYSWQYCLSLISILTFLGSASVEAVVSRILAEARSENFRFAARHSLKICLKRLAAIMSSGRCDPVH